MLNLNHLSLFKEQNPSMEETDAEDGINDEGKGEKM